MPGLNVFDQSDMMGRIAPPAKKRDVRRLPNGGYMVDGTLVADRDWTPDEGENYTPSNMAGRPTGRAQRYTPPPKKPTMLDTIKGALDRK